MKNFILQNTVWVTVMLISLLFIYEIANKKNSPRERAKVTNEREAIAEAKTLVEKWGGKDKLSRGQRIFNWDAPDVTHKTIEVKFGAGIPSRQKSYWIVSFLVYTEPGHVPSNDFAVWLPDDLSEMATLFQAID